MPLLLSAEQQARGRESVPGRDVSFEARRPHSKMENKAGLSIEHSSRMPRLDWCLYFATKTKAYSRGFATPRPTSRFSPRCYPLPNRYHSNDHQRKDKRIRKSRSMHSRDPGKVSTKTPVVQQAVINGSRFHAGTNRKWPGDDRRMICRASAKMDANRIGHEWTSS